MRNLRLDLCYEGTRYRGWQRLSTTDNTIQAKLEQALSRILDENKAYPQGFSKVGTAFLKEIKEKNNHE